MDTINIMLAISIILLLVVLTLTVSIFSAILVFIKLTKIDYDKL